uniref:Uncharacterized protein n=1 Tax=Cryptococcus bacillisporus CA1280 TaxID=1296109 RepID=A0A0D0VMS3_CRYGA|nr:hypothetical protein I312_02851 [Cryptococcus bacillisporus CA1280]
MIVYSAAGPLASSMPFYTGIYGGLYNGWGRYGFGPNYRTGWGGSWYGPYNYMSVEEKAKISGKEVLIDSSYVQVVELLYRDSMYTMPAAHDETLQAKSISGNHG